MSAAVLEVDPGSLVVAANVRKDVALTPEFVASVKEHGVLVPIMVHEGLDAFEVIDGQRRTLAAVEAGLTGVPVIVLDNPTSDADLVVEQLVVNENRTGLSEADQVGAVTELALFGLSAAAIAKKTGIKKKAVEQAVLVGKSPAASAAMRDRQLSFEAALGLAEFEGDEEAFADLSADLEKGWSIVHKAQQWRDRRALEAKAAEIEADPNLTLLSEAPDYYSEDPRSLRHLYVDAEFTRPLSDLPHEEVVALAGDGLCAYPTIGWGARDERTVTVGYAVKGWRARGLFGRETSGTAKPSTPEEAEALKASRRRDRETTKAWKSATVVRFDFLRELVARRSAPKGWEAPVAACLLSNQGSYSTTELRAMLAILGLEEDPKQYSVRGTVLDHLAANPGRTPQIMLAVALGATEGSFEFDRKGWQKPGAARYLMLLAGWGYELSEVEQAVIDAPKS